MGYGTVVREPALAPTAPLRTIAYTSVIVSTSDTAILGDHGHRSSDEIDRLSSQLCGPSQNATACFDR